MEGDIVKPTETNSQDVFTTETADLADALGPSVIRLHDGDQFNLRIEPVRKRLDDYDLRMLGYNGSIPGSHLHVDQIGDHRAGDQPR